MIRQQLPAYSPLFPGALLRAAFRAALRPGGERAALERLLAERYQANQVLLTASGTHALQTALALAASAAPWSGRPVALPAYTCYDMATAAVGAGVAVTFYDIDASTLCPDADGVRRALAYGAGVVVANSLYGFPLDWTWLRRECEAADALLVEDAAQGLGSLWEGREGGSFGDLTVLSFGRGKGWTGGGGGAVLFRPGFLEQARDRAAPSTSRLAQPQLSGNLRALCFSLMQWALGHPALFGIPSSIPALALGETRYKDPTPPAAMGATVAATAFAHAARAGAEVELRRANAARWLDLLDANRTSLRGAYRTPRPLDGGSCAYLRLPVLTTSTGPGADALARGGRAFGLARGYPQPLPDLAPLRPSIIASRARHEPGASDLAKHLFTVPTHSLVEERDMLGGARVLERAAESSS